MSRRIVLLLNNPFVADSRSWKLARSLAAAGNVVTVVARTREGLPDRQEREGFTIVRIDQPRPLRWLPAPGLPADARRRTGLRARVTDVAGRAAQAVRFLLVARQWADRVAAAVPAADIWQSEGLITLPLALRLRDRLGGRVVYDSRDIHVESAGFARLPGPWRRLLQERERRWAQAADAVLTVNEAYAAVLRRTLRVEPVIVMNGPVAWDRPNEPPRLLHERFGIPAGTPVVLALGAVAPNRGIERLIDAMAAVPAAHLVVIGDGSAKAAAEARAAGSGHGDRIHFGAAVAPDEILPLTAAADVAAIAIQGTTLNHRLTTPTRLFDALGAGTPVVASDLEGIAGIVRDTGAGILVDASETSAIAAGLREVLEAPPAQRAAWRDAALAAARGPYAWDRQVERLLATYERITRGA